MLILDFAHFFCFLFNTGLCADGFSFSLFFVFVLFHFLFYFVLFCFVLFVLFYFLPKFEEKKYVFIFTDHWEIRLHSFLCLSKEIFSLEMHEADSLVFLPTLHECNLCVDKLARFNDLIH